MVDMEKEKGDRERGGKKQKVRKWNAEYSGVYNRREGIEDLPAVELSCTPRPLDAMLLLPSWCLQAIAEQCIIIIPILSRLREMY